MSLLSLERLFRAVVIPSCTYGLSAISNQLCEDNYDVVEGRLVKLLFVVSKFASTSSLVNAVEWESESESERYLFDPHKKFIQSNNEKHLGSGTPIKTSLVANIRATYYVINKKN